MTDFAFNQTVPSPVKLTTPLGPAAGAWSSPKDIGKAVKLSATGPSHVLCADGDEIAGFVTSIEPITVNGGYRLGAVQTEGWIEAIVGSAQGGTGQTPMVVGDYVVAGAQSAIGTVGNAQQWASPPGTAPSLPTGPTAIVKTGSPTKKLWQCMAIVTGTGAAGDVVLLYRD